MTDTPIPSITINENTNCSELIAELILDHFAIPEGQQHLYLLRGMGRGAELGSICGAISGAIFAMNLILERHGATEPAITEAHNTFRQAFFDRFQAVNCSDIIELHFENPEFESRQQRFCGNLLDESTNEAVEIISMVTAILDPISQSMNRH